MRSVIAFLLGGIIGFATHWYMAQRPAAMATQNHQEATAKNLFDPDAIKDELSHSGQVIREKARQAGTAIK